jgi:hypothetical protein
MDNNFVHPVQEIPGYSQAKTRPAFITVLCILGFVGVATGTVYYGFTLYTSYISYNLMRSMQDTSSGLNSFGAYGNYDYAQMLFWSIVSNCVCIVSQFISLVGLILIFTLRKAGFYIYIISEFISLGFIIFVAIKTMSMSNGLFSGYMAGYYWGIIGVTVLFDLAFAVMHTINYKHLK